MAELDWCAHLAALRQGGMRLDDRIDFLCSGHLFAVEHAAARLVDHPRTKATIMHAPGQRIPLNDQLPDLGVQLLDLAVLARLRVLARTPIKGPRRLFLQLLLPRINLVRMDLVALRQIGHARLSRTASSAIFAFSAAGVFPGGAPAGQTDRPNPRAPQKSESVKPAPTAQAPEGKVDHKLNALKWPPDLRPPG